MIAIPSITKKKIDNAMLTSMQVLLSTFDITGIDITAMRKLKIPAPIVASSLADWERPAVLNIALE